MQATSIITFVESYLPGSTEKSGKLIARIRRTAISAGKTETFPELAAIILARSYQTNGRKRDARNLLTTYLLHNPATNSIVTALNANDQA